MVDEQRNKSIVMELATNSVRNTTVSTSNDDLYFEVVTRFWHPNLTKINRLDPQTGAMTTVCEIENKGKETRIRFSTDIAKDSKYGKSSLGEWKSVEDILQLAPERHGGVLVDSDGTEYRWKTHNRRFQLVRCGDDTKLPIVKYHRYKRHLGFWRMAKLATLEIRPNNIHSLERLIASFLLVERQRRHHAYAY
ncbi:hypothetical protein R3P38DRAFT_1717430 [Favolaschia claudopus]|uniref:DUF6593 domain-containing protein n=1 Tax=Favolaschia claudopus TaxID=2862362 RepID=A0AAW0AB97_9AGAR